MKTWLPLLALLAACTLADAEARAPQRPNLLVLVAMICAVIPPKSGTFRNDAVQELN